MQKQEVALFPELFPLVLRHIENPYRFLHWHRATKSVYEEFWQNKREEFLSKLSNWSEKSRIAFANQFHCDWYLEWLRADTALGSFRFLFSILDAAKKQISFLRILRNV